METMVKRIMDRIEDLIQDVGRWDLAVVVNHMEPDQQARGNGSIFLFRNGTDLVEGRLLFEIDEETVQLELYTVRLDSEPFRNPTQLWQAAARYTLGESLHNLMTGLEKALEDFPKEGDIIE